MYCNLNGLMGDTKLSSQMENFLEVWLKWGSGKVSGVETRAKSGPFFCNSVKLHFSHFFFLLRNKCVRRRAAVIATMFFFNVWYSFTSLNVINTFWKWVKSFSHLIRCFLRNLRLNNDLQSNNFIICEYALCAIYY